LNYTSRYVKNATTILFDWDGTLIDSFPAGFNASMSVLREFGLAVDRERFLETYSPNWYESYEKLGVPRERWEEADRMWRRTYRQQTPELFPFVTTMLRRLRDAGFILGIVTSGNRVRVRSELERFRLLEHFQATVYFEDTREKKPNPAPLACALGKLEVDASLTVYVGDRPEDVEMGRRVGTYTVAVESEYGPRRLLEEAGPDLLLPHAGHLPERLLKK
jgi:pyrophosphatase PpaX